jgi:hypothetical protein
MASGPTVTWKPVVSSLPRSENVSDYTSTWLVERDGKIRRKRRDVEEKKKERKKD